MDTASHLLLGATLAGLAYMQPAIAHDAALAQAVMIGTLIGSHAPDFDTVMRAKGFAAYIQYHRGVTHSVPALFVWPAFITAPICLLGSLGPYWPVVYLWTFLAVALHVSLDTLNAYGVQSARPFSRQWIHLDILNICEPVLLALHVIGLVLWRWSGLAPVPLFGSVYAATALFIAVRAWEHRGLVKLMAGNPDVRGVCHVIPTFRLGEWRFAAEAEDSFCTGRIVRGKPIVEADYPKEERNNVIRATMGVDGVRAFLGFAQRIHVTCREVSDGYEVSWSDVRFAHGRKLPFGVDVRLDKQLQVVSHRIGWRKKAWDPPFV